MRLICAICSVSRQEAKQAGDHVASPCSTRGSPYKSNFSPPWWDAISANPSLGQVCRFVFDSTKKTTQRTRRISVSDKQDSGETFVCSSVIVKQCPKPGNDAPNGHQHFKWHLFYHRDKFRIVFNARVCVPKGSTSFVAQRVEGLVFWPVLCNVVFNQQHEIHLNFFFFGGDRCWVGSWCSSTGPLLLMHSSLFLLEQ